MKSKIIKTITACLAAAFLAFAPMAAFTPTPAFADQCSPQVCSGNYPDSVKAGCGCSEARKDKLPGVIQIILNSIIAILGTVAVIYVIVGGVNYITSNGDTGKLEKAKKTILYAVIGLVVAALAFAVVNWVISILP